MSIEGGNAGAEFRRSVAAGFLKHCLVEGDAVELACAKRVRWRSLALSLCLQVAALAALLLVPLFGKTDRITLATWVPQAIYTVGGGGPHRSQQPSSARQPRATLADYNLLFQKPHAPTGTAARTEPTGEKGVDPNLPPDGGSGGENIIGAIGLAGQGDRPPPPGSTNPTVPPRARFAHLEPAMLIHRVEPMYPPLARQLRRSGRVELHAVIATDGTIQSLQVASGDPLFYQSALDAVRQWRYRPTILNGRPYEVETYITVIYAMP